MTIREIDPDSAVEIRLVAARMRQTLIEVLGEERAIALYSMDWLVERVRWHLDATGPAAKIYLTEGEQGEITGHAISRVEQDENGQPYGYFSTVFVDPSSRKQGIASLLIQRVESWLESRGMPKIVYNTGAHNAAVIRLFERHGFRITYGGGEMVS